MARQPGWRGSVILMAAALAGGFLLGTVSPFKSLLDAIVPHARFIAPTLQALAAVVIGASSILGRKQWTALVIGAFLLMAGVALSFSTSTVNIRVPKVLSVYHDTFDDATSGWPVSLNSSEIGRAGYLLNDRQYQVQMPNSVNGSTFMTYNVDTEDATIVVNAWIGLSDANNTARPGVGFRYLNSLNGYIFYINPYNRTFELQRKLGGSVTSLLGPVVSSAIRAQTEWNRVAISVWGPNISIEINGEHVLFTQDYTWSQGSVALGLEKNGNFEADARFANLNIAFTQ
jgi:hypothetical protein